MLSLTNLQHGIAKVVPKKEQKYQKYLKKFLLKTKNSNAQPVQISYPSTSRLEFPSPRKMLDASPNVESPPLGKV